MSGNGFDLVVFDMEGTLTCDPTLWELMHLSVGTWHSHGLPYWSRYRAGEIGYDEFAKMDVAAWGGSPLDMLNAAVEKVPLMPGCERLLPWLSSRGVHTAIISNGLERLGLRLVREFGLEKVLANRECAEAGVLTGDLEILVPFEAKGDALEKLAGELGVPLNRVMAIGDGPADIEMFRRAGKGVAFAPSHREVADGAHAVIEERDLSLVMSLFE